MFTVAVRFSNGERFHKAYADLDTAVAVYNELTEFGGVRNAEIYDEDGDRVDFDELDECEECECDAYSEYGYDPYCGCYTYDC